MLVLTGRDCYMPGSAPQNKGVPNHGVLDQFACVFHFSTLQNRSFCERLFYWQHTITTTLISENQLHDKKKMKRFSKKVLVIGYT